jgi:hypothetical protein
MDALNVSAAVHCPLNAQPTGGIACPGCFELTNSADGSRFWITLQDCPTDFGHAGDCSEGRGRLVRFVLAWGNDFETEGFAGLGNLTAKPVVVFLDPDFNRITTGEF